MWMRPRPQPSPTRWAAPPGRSTCSTSRPSETVSLDCDILVNNAGIQRISPIEDFDPADFRRIITLMLEAPFLLIRAALPHMYANNFGRIINLSSVHGLRASPFKSAYVSAKHGLEGLSKVTALEGGAHGVTSNCINPGYVRTPLVEPQIADQAKVHGIPESEVLAKIMLTEVSREAAGGAGGSCLPGRVAGLRRRRHGHRRQLTRWTAAGPRDVAPAGPTRRGTGELPAVRTGSGGLPSQFLRPVRYRRETHCRRSVPFATRVTPTSITPLTTWATVWYYLPGLLSSH